MVQNFLLLGFGLLALLAISACVSNEKVAVINTNVNKHTPQPFEPEWPPLPTSGFIKGRAATEKDIDDGNAVFVAARPEGKIIGKPLNIDIPQYAEWNDEETSRVRRVVVVQGEKADDKEYVGLVLVETGEQVVALLSEVRLLGTSKK